MPGLSEQHDSATATENSATWAIREERKKLEKPKKSEFEFFSVFRRYSPKAVSKQPNHVVVYLVRTQTKVRQVSGSFGDILDSHPE